MRKYPKHIKPVKCLVHGTVFKSTVTAAEAIGAHPRSVRKCCNEELKQLKGHVFRYIDDDTPERVDEPPMSEAKERLLEEIITYSVELPPKYANLKKKMLYSF